MKKILVILLFSSSAFADFAMTLDIDFFVEQVAEDCEGPKTDVAEAMGMG